MELSKSEVSEIKFKLQLLIREQNIIEYEQLMDYVQDNYDRNVYDVASSNTIFFNTYLRSRRYKAEKSKTIMVDVDTGEVK